MKTKSFQSSYSKLYLVTEDVYNRLLQCISDKTEEDELLKLNNSTTETASQPFDESSVEQINTSNQQKSDVLKVQDLESRLSLSKDVNLQTDEDDQIPSSETRKTDAVNSSMVDNATQTDMINTIDSSTQTDNNFIEDSRTELPAVKYNKDKSEPWKKYSCHICDKKFSLKKLVEKHIEIIHKNDRKSLNETNIQNDNEKMVFDANVKYPLVTSRDLYSRALNSKKCKIGKFKCYKCFKNFASNFSKKRHIKTFHKAVKELKSLGSFDSSTSQMLDINKNQKAVKRKHKDTFDTTAVKIIKRQPIKRTNFEDLNEIPVKRHRLSQGVKRKKESEDYDNAKKIRFQDWIVDV